MVRKKVTNSTVDESDKDHNVKKNKKKSARMDDDEYMVAEEIIEDTSALLESNASVGTNGKQRVETTEAEDVNCHNNIEKMKSKKQTTKNGDYDVNETLPAFSGTGGDSVDISNKKDKKVKKNFKLEDDEYALEKETSIHAPDAVGPPPEEEVPVAFLGKKKAKKNKDMKKREETEERTADLDSSNALSTAPDVFAHIDVSKLQATSTRNQGKGRRVQGFELLEEESENTSTELSKPSVSNAIVESEHLDGNYENELQFAGKKMGKKSKKSASAKFSDFDELEAILAQVDGDDSERNGSFDLHVNEKQTSAQLSTHSSLELNDGEVIQFTGKKKGKKGKSIVSKVRGDDDDYAVLPEVEVLKRVEEPSTVEVVPFKEEMPLGNAAGEDVAATSKKKPKKGKKGGRTVQEEDDLDAILAELDGPKFEKSVDTDKTRVPDNYEQPAPSEDIEGTNFTSVSGLAEVEKVAESAAAKKKKKKKEKEKAKPSVLETHGEADVQEQKDQHDEPAKSKVADKKVPKHVREMQERLAKMKEAEEKRKREEGEKRKKEEEEQQRLDELERQKEEAKRRRKEREKEKLQQKKLEGKLLTGKQKEEARRLTMMREQFLAQKGISGEGELVPKKEVAIPKKPKYDTKKKKRLLLADAVPSEDAVSQADDAQEPELLAADVVDEAVTESISEEAEEVARDEKMDSVEEEEEEEEDWDAKSWEENINLPVIKSAFAEDEENFTKPSSKTGKQTKPIFIQPSEAVTPASPSTQASLTTKYLQQKTSQSTVEPASEDETESEDDTEFRRHRDAKEKREARKADALKNRSADDLRSPICCILGHVDTGKTKLLDCIRRTNVQEGEAGGITQQIGATYFPMENIKERTKELKADAKLRVPGLLVIDTPGHESFTNLRARGSSLCDIAILVIDVMHGLEPQTIESLNLLKLRQTPFVVALNKVDRLYGWKPCIGAPIRVALKQQNKDVVSEFDMRLSQIVAQLKEQGMNSELYYRNKELRKYISIVPTSAISGEGIPDLLMLLVQLTQKLMEDKLMYVSELQCTVLEVKVVEGLGTTIDLVLVNGVLHEGDQIVVCGMQGPIVTTIRALLTPHPMKELRVKGTYQHHKELKAAQGLKIMAQGLEHAIAGTQLYVVGPDDELEDIKEEAMQDMKTVMSRVDNCGEGVCVQASTLGSLEALLEFLKSPAVKIPVSGISIGPVHKKDVMRASVMLEKKKKEYATILAFDVKVTSEAKELAEELGVKIFMADIIYHLFDQFTAYMNNVKEDKRKGAAEEAVFPCVLKIVPLHIFNKKDPIVVGVDVLEGIAKVGTPLCVPSRDNIDIGRIASLEINRQVVETAKKGQSVAMKIVGTNAEETQKMFGRHFDEDDELVSRITRNSIDLLKENYRDELTIEEWRLLVKLKKLFEIA